MGSVSDSFETVNAAAAAIVSAERRIQPSSTSVQQKRRWGDFWSRYWCFGSPKRISHASLAPEPTLLVVSTGSGGTSIIPARASGENHHPTTSSTATSSSAALMIPFVAPPSSPTSFLQSDSPSGGTQSPPGGAGLTPFSSTSYDSSSGPANIFAVGPYAHETQLVSPPVFSAFTTEPSTAAVTPPPEPVHFTTPSSPEEVPFAELLTSSLNNRVRRHSGSGHLPRYYYYQQFYYSGSPASQLISPGSANSTSGTSSPYPPLKRPPSLLEFRMVDAAKLFDSRRKWGSRLGSGSLTPDDGRVPPADDNNTQQQISQEEEEEEALVDHRVSFELNGEDGPTCIGKYNNSMERIKREVDEEEEEEDQCRLCNEEESNDSADSHQKVKRCKHKQYSSISLGSIKEFNFNHTHDPEFLDISSTAAGSDWWTEEDVDRDNTMPQGTWTFFPLLQPEVR